MSRRPRAYDRSLAPLLRVVQTSGVVILAACAPRAPSHTGLHLVGETLVHSKAPPAAAYAAYLRCRLALEAAPPRLAEAAAHIEVAIAADPRDPRLWTVRGEIAGRRGRGDEAMASVRRALSLVPEFPPAKRLEARLGRGEAVAGRPP